MNDEVFFEKTMKELGEVSPQSSPKHAHADPCLQLLGDDRKLIMAFHMLLMATQVLNIERVCMTSNNVAHPATW